jgi:oligopeptide transport system substrate-binding protein
MRSKWFAVLSIVMLASMVLAACQTAAPAQPTAAVAGPAKDTLRLNLGSYPDNLDPQQASFVNELAHLKLVYEALTRLDKDLKTVPGAAEKWEYNKDATEVTFTLRKGLKYSDGSLLNAKRYEYSLMRNIDPKTAGEYAAITDDIKGAAAWRGADLKTATPEALAKLKEGVAVKAYDTAGKACTGYDQADCLVLKVGTAAPAPYIHVVLGLWVTFPAKQELIEKGGEAWYMDVKNQIGNGPYIWKTNEQKVKGEFIPNPNYWRGQPKVNINYTYITDSATVFNAYKNNEYDIIGLAAEDLKTAKADATLSKEIQQYPGSCTYAVMFHQLKEPFTDQKVREAFALALDREGWVKDVLSGLGAPTLTWIPKGFPGYDANEKRWGFDPAAAKAALAASKYGSVDKLPPIELAFSDSARNRTRYEWLAAKWKEVLGVTVKLLPTESTAYTALTKDVKTAPLAFILGWCADYPDPQNWLSVYWMTGAFGERIGYSNKDLDAKMKMADAELDPTKRMALYDEAQKMLITGAPVAFMWNNVNTYLVKPYVKGLQFTPQDSDWAGSNDVLTITIQK